MNIPSRVCALLLPAFLLGCLDRQTQTTDSPVLARVNGSEITHHQFERALTKTGFAAPADAVREEVALKLIDRELALQAALAGKLDRRPDIMLRLEEARRDILAAAWADRIASEVPPVSREDVARYYKSHPGLFAERAIYRLHEMTVSVDQAGLDELKQHLVAGGRVDGLPEWMRSHGLAFNDQRVIRAAEQLPIEVLPRLSALAVGEHLIFESPRGVIIYTLLDVQAAPVAWEAAEARIYAYLKKRNGRVSVEREMRRMRADASIERTQSGVASAGATP